MGDQVFLKIEEQKMIWCEEALLKYHVSIKKYMVHYTAQS